MKLSGLDSALALALIVLAAPSTVRAGSFELTVTGESGQPLLCRVLLKSADGECFVPTKAATLKTGRDEWFMSSGRSTVDVPDGRLLLRVEHGLEYVRFKEWMVVAQTDVKKEVQLRRWVNMQQRGYLTGENHLHVDSKQLAPMQAAEGLDFGTSLTWWRGPDAKRPVPPGEGRTRLLAFGGRSVPTSIFDAPGVPPTSRTCPHRWRSRQNLVARILVT
jgi:hypothetical protein